MKRILTLLLLLAIAKGVSAQSTTISGTITDSGGQTWNGGTYIFTWVQGPNPPPFNWTGGTLQTTISGALNGSGAYSVSIPSNSAISPGGTAWVAQFCPQATSPCFSTGQFTVQGSTMTMAPTPPAIAISLINPSPGLMRAYADGEIASAIVASQYYNLSSQTVRICSAVSGQACVSWVTSAGGSGIAPPAGDIGGTTLSPTVVSTHLTAPLPINQGGTGTTTPGLIPGTNITITGSWPDQTINSTAAGGVTSVNSITGAVGVVAGSNVTVTNLGQNITISSSGVSTVQNPLTSSGLSNGAFPLQINGNVATKGPNPDIDITTFGARPFGPFVVPNIPGATVSIGSGSATATLNAAYFSNGDGVTIFKGGANLALATPTAPTVVSSLAASQTNTGIDVNAPTSGESTTWCYKISGVDMGRGLSAASLPTCISNGVAALGPHTMAITGSSQLNGTVTITTAARSPEVLAPGTTIGVEPSGGNPQYWETIAAVPDNTHFTFTTVEDTRSGMLTNNGFTGGSFNYWNSNKLILPAPPPNVIEYLIWRSTDGGATYPAPTHLTHPINDTATALQSEYRIWDDYGPTMSGNETFGYWVPTTPPASTVPDSLTTTVLSGGGTTTVTLAANAGTAVSGGTVLLDACPGFKAAMNFADANGGTVYFPAQSNGIGFTFNSLCDVSTNTHRTGVSVASQITLNDTLKVGESIWSGIASNAQNFAFSITPGQFIAVTRANPAIWQNANSEVFWQDFFISGQTNGYILMYLEGGSLPTGILKNMSIAGGGGITNQDFSGIALYMIAGEGVASGLQVNNAVITTSAPAVNLGGWGVTVTPAWVMKNYGQVYIDGLYMQATGIWYEPDTAGAILTVNNKYEMQGAADPWLTTYVTGGIVTGYIDIKAPIQDTSFGCILFNSSPFGLMGNALTIDYPLPAQGGVTVCGTPYYEVLSKGLYGGQSNLGQTTNANEKLFGTGIDGTLATNQGTLYAAQRFREGVEIDSPYSIHSSVSGPPTACTASASGGGGFTGTANFNIVPVYPDNGEGNTLYSCSVTGLSSNGVALSYPPASGAIGYDIYINGVLLNFNSCVVPQTALTSLTLTVATNCTFSQPTIAGSGPTGMDSLMVWAPKFEITSGGTSYVAAGKICSQVVIAMPTSTVLTLTGSSTATGSCPGVTTGDSISCTSAVQIAGVTGFVPASSAGGILTINIWPTANTINAQYLNYTAGSITPGPLNINCGVFR